MLTESLLFAGFRLMAVALILMGGLDLFLQVLDSWYRFDPNYLVSFLLQTVLKPFLLLLSGGFLLRFSTGLARRLSAGFTSGES
ncbi:MAG: hypothetical protein R6V45_09935 [Oceanipulchritudo sp.]